MRSIAPLASAALAVFALAGCGSGTAKTVSVSGGIGTAGTASRSSANGSATPTATTPGGASATAAGAGGTATAPPTRTATAPAFTEQSSGGGEGLGRAVAVVKAHGYTPEDASQYRADQTLRVLIGSRRPLGDGYAQQAFFFLDGRYLGTDASAPSAAIEVLAQSDTEVTLGYRLYRRGDPLCCAKGGRAAVRFQLDNGRLSALDPIPPAESSTGPSRR